MQKLIRAENAALIGIGEKTLKAKREYYGMPKQPPTLVFLPAVEPGNRNYGEIPGRIALFSDFAVRQVNYPTLVWYVVGDGAQACVSAPPEYMQHHWNSGWIEEGLKEIIGKWSDVDEQA